jgi:hypothetical protein
VCLYSGFHGRFFSAKCEIFRLFLLNCEQSSINNLFEWSQFKRNRRNNAHFAEKKRSWNQALWTCLWDMWQHPVICLWPKCIIFVRLWACLWDPACWDSVICSGLWPHCILINTPRYSMYQHPVICSFVSNVTKPVLWIHSLTLCAASAFSLYYVMGPVRIFLRPHWMMPAHALRYPSVSLSGYRAYVCFKVFVNTELKRPTCATSGNCNVLIYGTVTTRSYYRKESAASSPMDQSQHAQFAE